MEVAGRRIAVVHRLVDAPRVEEWDVLVYGHCHRQHADREGERLLLNPGAAGRRGFHTRRSVARLSVDETGVEWEFVDLGARSAAGGDGGCGVTAAALNRERLRRRSLR